MASAAAPAAFGIPELLMSLRNAHMAAISSAARMIQQHDETKREMPESAASVAMIALPEAMVKARQMIDTLVQFAGFNQASTTKPKGHPPDPDREQIEAAYNRGERSYFTIVENLQLKKLNDRMPLTRVERVINAMQKRLKKASDSKGRQE